MQYDIGKFFDLTSDFLCIIGTDGYIRRVNTSFQKILGWEPDELLARPFNELVHPDDLDVCSGAIQKSLSDQHSGSFESRLRCKSEGYRTISWTFNVGVDSKLLFGVGRDVSDLRKMQDQFRLAVEAAPNAMVLADGHGRIVYANKQTEKIFGYDHGALVGEAVESLLPERLRGKHRASRDQFLQMHESRPMGSGRDLTARRRDGSEFPVEIGLTPVEMPDGPLIIASLLDLTARKKIEDRMLEQSRVLDDLNRKLAELATTDELTHLKNRRAFVEELRRSVYRCQRTGRPLSVVMMDVDYFKSFNDRFGHPAGDGVLKAVARLLETGVRRSDFVARYGGEEFALILPEADSGRAVLLAERLRGTIERTPWRHQSVTASFGASTLGAVKGFASPDPSTTDRLVGEADKALYYSKEHGRNRVTHIENYLEEQTVTP